MFKRFFSGKKKDKSTVTQKAENPVAPKEPTSSKSSESSAISSSASQKNAPKPIQTAVGLRTPGQNYNGDCSVCKRVFDYSFSVVNTVANNRTGGYCFNCGKEYCPQHVAWELVSTLGKYDPNSNLPQETRDFLPDAYSAVCPNCDLILHLHPHHEGQVRWRPAKR